MTEESYINERDLHQSVINLMNDKEQMDKFLKANQYQNENDFRSGMIFGMTILAIYASVHADKILIAHGTDEDYLDVIRDLYKGGKFSIVHDENKFNPEKHDGLIHYGCLCIRGNALDIKLRELIPWYTRNNCISSLINKGALRMNKDKHTVKIGNTYNGRFYAIKLEMLE